MADDTPIIPITPDTADDLRQLETDLTALDAPNTPDKQVAHDLASLIEHDPQNVVNPDRTTGIKLTRGLNAFHKMVAQYLAMGFTQTAAADELSKLTGRRVQNSYISQLTRVPVFAQYLAEQQQALQEKIGKAIIQPQFQARASKGMEVIDDILDGNFEDEKRARLQLDAVRFTTEQGFGKPTQRSETTIKRSDPHREALEIDEQLAALEQQIKVIEAKGTIIATDDMDDLDDSDMGEP